jgi:hypothetical protein
VYYWKHISKKTGYEMLAATYWSGLERITEWVSVQNPKAKHFYYEWWRQRSPVEPPATVDEALSHTTQFRTPVRIHVWTNKDPKQVTRVEW